MNKISTTKMADHIWQMAEVFREPQDIMGQWGVDTSRLLSELLYWEFFVTDFSLFLSKLDPEIKRDLRDRFTSTFMTTHTVGDRQELQQAIAQRGARYAPAMQRSMGAEALNAVGVVFAELIGKAESFPIAMCMETVFRTQVMAIPQFLHTVQEKGRIVLE